MKRYMALLADMESAGYLEEDPDGEWVRYEDAQRLLAEKDARIAELVAQNHRLVGRIDALKADAPLPEDE